MRRLLITGEIILGLMRLAAQAEARQGRWSLAQAQGAAEGKPWETETRRNKPRPGRGYAGQGGAATAGP